MSSDLPSRSKSRRRRSAPYLGFAAFAIAAAIAPLFGSLVTTNIFVVAENDPISEDVYVTSQSAVVDGLLDGDLTVFSGNVTINGEVTGDINFFSSGTVRISEGAVVGGALRGVAVNVTISGSVGSDVFASAASIVVEETGVVARDVMGFGGVLRIEGSVGRDVRGRTMRTVIDGSVSGDTDVATQKFEVGSAAVIEGDILYRSPVGASIDAAAEISGTVTRLPTQSNFVYGVILSLANMIGFLGFMVAGLVALLLLRGSGSRATGAMLVKPVRSFLVGIAAVVIAPVAVVVLAASLVGLPLALILVCGIVVAFIVGPVPAVTALGNRVLLGRGGLFGAFAAGAVLWRFGIWVIPVVGGFLYLLGLVWGIGAWIVGLMDTRRGTDYPVALVPPSMIAAGGVPDGWEPPLAPFVESVETEGQPQLDEGDNEPMVEPEHPNQAGPTEAEEDAVEREGHPDEAPIIESVALGESGPDANGDERSAGAEDPDAGGDDWGLPGS